MKMNGVGIDMRGEAHSHNSHYSMLLYIIIIVITMPNS